MSAGRVNKRCECNFTRRRSRGVSITELPENLLYGLLRLGHRLLRTLAAELSANGRRTFFGIISGLFAPIRDVWRCFVPKSRSSVVAPSLGKH
jgi:hypothetical protein